MFGDLGRGRQMMATTTTTTISSSRARVASSGHFSTVDCGTFSNHLSGSLSRSQNLGVCVPSVTSLFLPVGPFSSTIFCGAATQPLVYGCVRFRPCALSSSKKKNASPNCLFRLSASVCVCLSDLDHSGVLFLTHFWGLSCLHLVQSWI